MPEELPGEDKEMPVWKMLLLIVLGGVMIVFGSDVAVDAATELARIFGMSERLIGLTIVAFGTSLPELVTSATAAVKGTVGYCGGQYRGQQYFQYTLRSRHVGPDHAGHLCFRFPGGQRGMHCGGCAPVGAGMQEAQAWQTGRCVSAGGVRGVFCVFDRVTNQSTRSLPQKNTATVPGPV